MFYTCFCFVSEEGRGFGEGSFTYSWQDTGFTAMPSPVAFSTAQERWFWKPLLSPPRVELSSFVSLLAERWGGVGGGVMNGRDPNDSCPKLKAVLEKGRRGNSS